MAFEFLFYRKDETLYDTYLFEDEFIQEGPNILQMDENSDVVFDGFFGLVKDYAGHIDENEIVKWYSLGELIAKKEHPAVSKATDKLNLREKSSGELLDSFIAGAAMPYKDYAATKVGEWVTKLAMMCLPVLESRGAKLTGIYPPDSKQYRHLETRYKRNSIGELRAERISQQKQILAGNTSETTTTRFYLVKQGIEARISELRKKKKEQQIQKEYDLFFGGLTDDVLLFKYLFYHSSLHSTSKLQLRLAANSIEREFDKRGLIHKKANRESESLQFFELVFLTLTDNQLLVLDSQFTLQKISSERLEAQSSHPVLTSLVGEYKRRKLKAVEGGFVKELLIKEKETLVHWKYRLLTLMFIIICVLLLNWFIQESKKKKTRVYIQEVIEKVEEPISSYKALTPEKLVAFYNKTDSNSIKEVAKEFDFTLESDQENTYFGLCWRLTSIDESQFIYINYEGQLLFEPGKHFAECIDFIEKNYSAIGEKILDGFTYKCYRNDKGLEFRVSNDGAVYVF